jgi:hypothetical protein
MARTNRRGVRGLLVRTLMLSFIATTVTRAAAAQGAVPSDTAVRHVGGGSYLFHYRPLGMPGVQANTEVYATDAGAAERTVITDRSLNAVLQLVVP